LQYGRPAGHFENQKQLKTENTHLAKGKVDGALAPETRLPAHNNILENTRLFLLPVKVGFEFQQRQKHVAVLVRVLVAAVQQ
jgi:hypothetical protein